MSAPEAFGAPNATQVRLRRLIVELARRIQARRLASPGAQGTPPAAGGKGLAGGSAPTGAPDAGQIQQAGRRALLRRLLAGGDGREARPRGRNRHARRTGRARGRG